MLGECNQYSYWAAVLWGICKSFPELAIAVLAVALKGLWALIQI